MSQWAELRHQHFVERVPKKALARRFGLDIKTVRRALDCEEPPRRAPVVRPRLLGPHLVEHGGLEDPVLADGPDLPENLVLDRVGPDGQGRGGLDDVWRSV